MKQSGWKPGGNVAVTEKPYDIPSYSLTTARAAPGEEIKAEGDHIHAYTDGSLENCYVRVNQQGAAPILLSEVGTLDLPYFYRLYLTTTAQSGKTLWLLTGRQMTSSARLQVSPSRSTVRSDKDTHFTGAIVQNAIESENLTGLLQNKVKITGVAVQSDQALDYRLIFWNKDTMEDTDLDVDAFVGEIEVDLAAYGFRIAGANQYYMDIRGISLDYEDLDATQEIHISLQNLSATAKNAGATGEIVAEIWYELM